MSLCKEVAEAILFAGRGSIEDVVRIFPRYSRRELMKAIHNAYSWGYIAIEHRGRGANNPTIWGPGRAPMEKPPKVASVFDLASPRSDWPRHQAGTVYRPLGEWNTESEEEALA